MHETLEQIEGIVWPDAPADSSSMMLRCNALRKVPLDQFTPGDFRVMLGQHIGVEQVVPRALAILSLEPLVEGDYFPGDLLTNILRLPMEFWATDTAALNQVRGIAQRALEELKAAEHLYASDAELVADIEAFIAAHA